MARIKYTKNELKKQKEALARYKRYLPTLLLKKIQLQTEIRKIRIKEDELNRAYKENENKLFTWVQLLGQDFKLTSLISIVAIDKEIGNIAGIDIPVFTGVRIDAKEYSLFTYPHWVDRALEELQKLITLRAELNIIHKQLSLLSEELRITNQRVNLFEKVKIPEASENIRIIKIYLGDQQTNTVVRGKLAKNKIKAKQE
ncbi:MAG: V-type ATP synthase subunit D [Spirochaetales bacterium]|nr:V-type ATP synthase subunit D [Spirochaetales bacterium]